MKAFLFLNLFLFCWMIFGFIVDAGTLRAPERYKKSLRNLKLFIFPISYQCGTVYAASSFFSPTAKNKFKTSYSFLHDRENSILCRREFLNNNRRKHCGLFNRYRNDDDDALWFKSAYDPNDADDPSLLKAIEEANEMKRRHYEELSKVGENGGFFGTRRKIPPELKNQKNLQKWLKIGDEENEDFDFLNEETVEKDGTD